ncbi:SurA N-terminal domain-containing protein [Cognatilysobacter lacus]|uniref:Periplasmic chaperone PpiD n=1 Tax=Cognatilysobacter lacus TaxID=1643323 RepID=A0A5D8ZC79_9GAMM|nr:SurA N-terminal domain-containing protein [Lysobacter lacus]TZF91712.1 peptidylprolyl isomerase [Lysobacter lacus]
MLQNLRDKTSGWVATVVLGLLVVPFAFVGVQDYFQRSREMPVASISAPPSWWASAPAAWPVSMLWERQDVSQRDFRERFEQERQAARQQQGAQFDARDFESAASKRKVLDGLIDERVQGLWAQRQGIAVSDAMVQGEIAAIPAFQSNGKFDLQQYRLALRTLNPPRTERQFEQLVRDGLAQSMLRTTVGASAFATPTSTDRLVALLGERRDLSMVELPALPADTAPVSPTEIESWYRGHSAAYRAPETVALEYVDIDASTLPAAAPIDEAALRERYEQEKTRFVAPEQRQASHILISVPAGASASIDKAAHDKATRLAAQARVPGADFAALARANSDDTGSKAAGGDLGFVARGALAPAFEKTLFAMQPGQVSDPVRTEFGWHVITLRQVQAGRQEAFEQARPALEKELADSAREKQFNEVTSKIVDAVLKNPSTLGPAARQVGVPLLTAGPLARGQGSGALAHPLVQRTAFSETAIGQGMVSDPIDIGKDHTVLLRVTGHTAARQLALPEVRDRVVAAIHADRLLKASRTRAEAIAAQVKAGQPLAQVAASQGLPPPKPLLGVPRGAEVLAPGVSDAFFAAYAPRGKAAVGSKVLPDGRAIVFVVDAVKPGNVADVGGDAAQIARQIAQLHGVVDFDATVRALRRSYKVQVNESNL